MAYVPPPLQLTREEFERRVAAGARTLEEIDPALFVWKERQDKLHKFQAIVLVLGGFLLLALLLAITLSTQISP